MIWGKYCFSCSVVIFACVITSRKMGFAFWNHIKSVCTRQNWNEYALQAVSLLQTAPLDSWKKNFPLTLATAGLGFGHVPFQKMGGFSFWAFLVCSSVYPNFPFVTALKKKASPMLQLHNMYCLVCLLFSCHSDVACPQWDLSRQHKRKSLCLLQRFQLGCQPADQSHVPWPHWYVCALLMVDILCSSLLCRQGFLASRINVWQVHMFPCSKKYSYPPVAVCRIPLVVCNCLTFAQVAAFFCCYAAACNTRVCWEE